MPYIDSAGLMRLHNALLGIRAEILPLKHWSTSLYYSASLFGKWEVRPPEVSQATFLQAAPMFGVIQVRLTFRRPASVSFTSPACAFELLLLSKHWNSREVKATALFFITVWVCYWMAASIFHSDTEPGFCRRRNHGYQVSMSFSFETISSAE